MVPNFSSEETEKDINGSRNLYELRKDQVSVYKKGRKKPVKSLTLSGEKIKRFSFKGSKGTYYIKVAKSGRQTNGSYWLYQY